VPPSLTQIDPNKEALMQKLLGQSSVSTAKKIKIIKIKTRQVSKGPEPVTPTENLKEELNAALDEFEAKSDDSFGNNDLNDAF
jgi:hypothetical protein